MTSSELLGTSFTILTKIVGTINGLLGGLFTPDLMPYAVLGLSLLGGYFLRELIAKSDKKPFWFILISLMLFLSLRYIGFGG